MQATTEIRHLPVKYTNEELQEIGLKLAETHRDIARLEDQKKEEADRFKGLIAEKQLDATMFARQRIDGYHSEPIECSVEFDFKSGTKTISRMDTGEAVTTLPLSPDERQMEIREVAETAPPLRRR